MSGLSDEQRKAIAYALYEYPLGSPQLEDAVRRLAPVVENLLAVEREAGAAEVRARVEAVADKWEKGADIHRERALRDADMEADWIADDYADRARTLRAAMNGGE